MMRQTVRIKRTNLLMLSDDERRRRLSALDEAAEIASGDEDQSEDEDEPSEGE